MRRFLSVLSSSAIKQQVNSRTISQLNVINKREVESSKCFGGLVFNQQPSAKFSLSTIDYLFGKKPSGNKQNSSSSSSSSSGDRKKKGRNQSEVCNNKNINNKKDKNKTINQSGQNNCGFSSKLGTEKSKLGDSIKQAADGLRGNKVNKKSVRSGDNFDKNSNYSDCDNKSKSKRMSNNSVRHNKSKQQFTMDLGNNQTARIDYKPLGKGKIEMYHTEVPAELRNRGIGKALAKGSLEQAKNDNLKVKLTCTYLIKHLDNFADERLKSIVVEK